MKFTNRVTDNRFLFLLLFLFLISSGCSSDFSGFSGFSGKSGKENTDNEITDDGDDNDDGELVTGESQGSITVGEDGYLCRKTSDDSDALPDDKIGASRVGSTVFYKNVAVDPGNSGNDPSSNHGLIPYKLSEKTTLDSTSFTLSKSLLSKFKDSSVDEIEWLVFAHQFKNGTDLIEVEAKNSSKTYSSDYTPNIYSAYAFISLRNFEETSKGWVGDLSIIAFGYDPNSSAPHNVAIGGAVNAAAQIGTKFLEAASEFVPPDIDEKGIDLEDFSLKIDIGANLYDSVQYRTVQQTLWGAKPIPLCE